MYFGLSSDEMCVLLFIVLALLIYLRSYEVKM
jgi:hypothetical protein